MSGIVSVLHPLRVVTGVPLVIEGWMLPIWVNVPGFAVDKPKVLTISG